VALGFKMEEYGECLETSHWKQFRLARFQARRKRDGHNHCEICSAQDKLIVHHLTYDRLGEELPTDVRIICRDCHDNKLHRSGVGVDQKHAGYVPWRQTKK
jgi:5-methylcytosine-specific restriction endonuclease McrA